MTKFSIPWSQLASVQWQCYPGFYQAVNSHTWVASLVASFLLSACECYSGAIRGESKAVFTSQDTTPALQTCSKMSPEQGGVTGAATTPRKTNYQGKIHSNYFKYFISVYNQISAAAEISSRVVHYELLSALLGLRMCCRKWIIIAKIIPYHHAVKFLCDETHDLHQQP